MPVALDVDWDEMQSVAETGIPLPEVAARYGVEYEAVRKRAQRGKWLTRAVVHKAHKRHTLSRAVPTGPNKLQIAVESHEMRRNHLTERTHRLAMRLLDGAGTAADAGTLKCETVRDAVDAVKLARLNLGMDVGEAKVQLNLWAGSSDCRASVGVREVGEVEEE